ncbi:hypothetical protein PR002_g13772 [Phytophthora rubi]|uniref:SET domain-containing protein n=1 Tax=Phytophthora rubi TaxID=129364 RepID=A0A6A3LDB9_9STRA|nr:hypothetical protein PR002_g13772 [Phytophthora rubi]
MVHLTHSAVHWRLRCILDTSSSDDENTSPNVPPSEPGKSKGVLSCRSDPGEESDQDEVESSGTATPPWLPVGHSKLGLSKAQSNPPPASNVAPPLISPPVVVPTPINPTTSSPVYLKTRPSSPRIPPRTAPLRTRQTGRHSRRQAAAPYGHSHPAGQRPEHPVINPRGASRTNPEAVRRRADMPTPNDVFAPARWPCRVAHLREQFNPLGTTFPDVPHFGWCTCSSPCRTDRCRNALMSLYCNANCCPYQGKCDNGLEESSKVYLGRNVRTSTFGVVAAEDIHAGEVLGQYLGQMEHVSIRGHDRPRNSGYRLVMKTRPEKPKVSVCVAINAEDMGGLMRFVNHSCKPFSKFVEVANGRRTTVVVVTTEEIHQGEQVTADYGDDLWFVCRCGYDGCRHRDIQDLRDP